MPRLGVTALRWMLLVVNLAALTGVLLLAVSYIRPSKDDELRMTLPEPSAFVVPPEAEQVFDQGQLRTMLQRHNRKPPPPPRPPAPPREREPEIVDGGPLGTWEIASTTIKDSYRAVQIQERVETSTVTTTRPSRTSARTSSRSRVPPNRSRRAGSRTSRRPAAASQQRTRYVREGSNFKIDDKVYVAVSIEVYPEERFEYKDGANRKYVITREPVELEGVELDNAGRIVTLIGQIDDGETTPGAPAAVPDDERGSIRGGRSAATPSRQPATQRQPTRGRPQATPNNKDAKKELDKAVEEAKKSGKLSPSDQKTLEAAGKGLKNDR